MGTEVLTVTAEDKQHLRADRTRRATVRQRAEKAASQDQAKSKDGKPRLSATHRNLSEDKRFKLFSARPTGRD